ncbi:co-chaperone GroES [Candidatus Aerophobetes bacterium]|uniref:Co-chaperonin GroES n=1 Tax=Aerophobetes bacterium TaxID=2030807 RepID=A0A523W8P1_UNCAE|nr:MAG: co-chaperone GroES [Candidatus Aerophobetes bacterium]
MEIRPLQDRIVVKRVKEEEKTKGGIIIPEIAKEKPVQGKVIAVGDTTQSIKVGSRVLFGRYMGTEILIDDVEHLIMREDDVLGIIEE